MSLCHKRKLLATQKNYLLNCLITIIIYFPPVQLQLIQFTDSFCSAGFSCALLFAISFPIIFPVLALLFFCFVDFYRTLNSSVLLPTSFLLLFSLGFSRFLYRENSKTLEAMFSGNLSVCVVLVVVVVKVVVYWFELIT